MDLSSFWTKGKKQQTLVFNFSDVHDKYDDDEASEFSIGNKKFFFRNHALHLYLDKIAFNSA